ncbi:hypothetical protein F3Y22_tig00000405pilonHSYRG00010 [Hibiscus syriacus]|uniref:RNase H type-1 domain-containing protein n=1 Tax=Hibiscus syriacus TaxID=106335 RepID=A0A6A3D144_HIBSY|nr:hypothetical protein F3Y22_tig00000405pilonHSYRG00010 [Hibiscus syriacus]
MVALLQASISESSQAVDNVGDVGRGCELEVELTDQSADVPYLSSASSLVTMLLVKKINPLLKMFVIMPIYIDHGDLLLQSLRLKNDLVTNEVPASNYRSNYRVDSRWCKPSSSWLKVNADGAVGGTLKMAAVWGVLRDDQGRWIFGFARSLGICSVLMAELLAIHDSLVHAWNLGFGKIQLETDCAKAVELLKENNRVDDSCAVVSLIHKLLQRDWLVKTSHVHREAL